MLSCMVCLVVCQHFFVLWLYFGHVMAPKPLKCLYCSVTKLSKGKMYLKGQRATCAWAVKPIQMKKTLRIASFMIYLPAHWDAGEVVERIAGDLRRFQM